MQLKPHSFVETGQIPQKLAHKDIPQQSYTPNSTISSSDRTIKAIFPTKSTKRKIKLRSFHQKEISYNSGTHLKDLIEQNEVY